MPNIERIKLNEIYLDESQTAVSKLLAALENYAAVKPKITALSDYYKTDWLTDVKDDDSGLLPSDLKRGVLSEDAIFNLLTDDAAIHRIVSELFFG